MGGALSSSLAWILQIGREDRERVGMDGYESQLAIPKVLVWK